MIIKNLDSNFGHVFNLDATEDNVNNYMIVIETDATQTEIINYIIDKLKRGFVAYFDRIDTMSQFIINSVGAQGTDVVIGLLDMNTPSITLSKYTVGDRTFWGVAVAK